MFIINLSIFIIYYFYKRQIFKKGLRSRKQSSLVGQTGFSSQYNGEFQSYLMFFGQKLKK
jgi:hypothetical protein